MPANPNLRPATARPSLLCLIHDTRQDSSAGSLGQSAAKVPTGTATAGDRIGILLQPGACLGPETAYLNGQHEEYQATGVLKIRERSCTTRRTWTAPPLGGAARGPSPVPECRAVLRVARKIAPFPSLPSAPLAPL